jgi:hypothetical protein
MSGLRCLTADKPHRCGECGRLIPVGHKYWRKFKEPKGNNLGVDERTHTNCLNYANQPELPVGFNQNRKSGEAILKGLS